MPLQEPSVLARTFHIQVLGRTLEHLGTQMYKHRDAALAELIANSWDANATWVNLEIPEDGVFLADAVLRVSDNGCGMSPDQVEAEYLVLGRNRREASSDPPNRPVMGRKGIGKLAGFGIAEKMKVTTYQDGTATEFILDVARLRKPPGESGPMDVPGTVVKTDRSDGTTLELSAIKSRSPLDLDELRQSLARRFSRSVRGHMEIRINGVPIPEPDFDFELRQPPEVGQFSEVTLSDGATARFWYGFSKKVLQYKVLRGFTVQSHGKTAQAPPFFFNVEATASGQHGTRYLTGVIEIDSIDDGRDSDSDFISTDRQEIDWGAEGTQVLATWGAELTRRALREWANRRGEQMTRQVESDPKFAERISALDGRSQQQLKKALSTLGQADAEENRARDLADALIRAFEYRHFHDVIEEIENTQDDPKQLGLLLGYFSEWRVLESRAILEIIKGRLGIVEKFGRMITDDTRETASKLGLDNLHDLIAGYPWLLNPEWQIMAEERTLSKQLQEWGTADIDADDRSRYDFLALEGDGRVVVIEIKRSGHTVSLTDLQRLDSYVEKIRLARTNASGVFISGGRYAVSDQHIENYRARSDFALLTWAEIHERTRAFYEHYRAVLEGVTKHGDFESKAREVAAARRVIETDSSHRDKQARADGVGPGAGEDRPTRAPEGSAG